MDMSPSRWISDWDFDDYDIANQYNVDTFDDFTIQEMAGIEESLRQSISPASNSSNPSIENNSSMQLKSSVGNNNNPITLDNGEPNVSYSPSSQVICFENNINASSPSDDNQFKFQYGSLSDQSLNRKENTTNDLNHGKRHGTPKAKQGKKRTQTMTKTVQAQDHIMAERKRREKLTRGFIALSAVVPGLKKMDKASVLEDAIKYIKQLQENNKALEEQAKKKPITSVVFFKKSQVSSDDDNSSCDENFDGNAELDLPDIEAKVSEKDVLLRIHSDMHKGFLVNILSEVEKLHLTVTNSSILPFGSSLDITIIAQMDSEFNMTGKDLVKNLRHACLGKVN